MTSGVIARILTCDRGDNRFGEESPRCSVRKSAPVITAITGGPMTQFRVGTQRQCLPSENSGPNERRIIYAVVHGQHEFLLGGKRGKLGVCTYGCKIRNHPENPLCLFAFGIVFFLMFVHTRGGCACAW